MINTGVNEGSAKIYQFPAGGRSALAGRRYGEAKSEQKLRIDVAPGVETR